MTIHEDPPRLLDADAQVDPVLREMLRMASTNAPTAAQLESLAIKVTAATAATAGVGIGMKLQAWLGKAGVAKASIVLLTGGALWGAQQLWVARAPERVRVSAPARRIEAPLVAAPPALESVRVPAPAVSAVSNDADPKPAVEAVRAEAAARSEEVVAEATDNAEIERRQAATAARKPAAVRVASSAAPSQTSESEAPRAPVASELELLGSAQTLLAKDPRGALGVLDEVARAYPRGAFAEEREALAIDALRRLGRAGEMRTRGRAFLERYPASPHRDRIRTWLE